MVKEKQAIAVQVGERIRYFRKMKNMSQEALGLECGLNSAFIGHIERGLKSPTVGTLEKICNGLDIPLVELFDFDTDTTVKNEFALEKIRITMQSLTSEQANKLADIVQNIVLFKTE